MNMDMEVTFPGGSRVAANWEGMAVDTDQAVEDGGDGAGPQPFALFLASLATCSGYYAMAFCKAREIPLDGLKLIQRLVTDEEGKKILRIEQEVIPPEGLPEKYDKAIARAVGQCAVKKIIMNPPEIVIHTKRG